MQHEIPKRMTAGELARVIVEDDIDPYDHEAIVHSLVARGKRPDQVHLSIFPSAAYVVVNQRKAFNAAA